MFRVCAKSNKLSPQNHDMMRKLIIIAFLLCVSLHISSSLRNSVPKQQGDSSSSSSNSKACNKGSAHTDCWEKLKIIKHMKEKDPNFYKCMKKFCCNEKAFIEDQKKLNKTMDEIMHTKEKRCPRMTGAAVSFFG